MSRALRPKLSFTSLRTLQVLDGGICIVLMLHHASILTMQSGFFTNSKKAVLLAFCLFPVLLALPLEWNALWICLIVYQFFLNVFLRQISFICRLAAFEILPVLCYQFLEWMAAIWYWSMCVSFLYILWPKDPLLTPADANAHRCHPSSCSLVNWMLRCMLLRW
jgi:hypothetical protein